MRTLDDEHHYNAGYSDGYEAAKKEEHYEPAEPLSAEKQAKAALEAAVACCPDGWVVVPAKPTPEMVNLLWLHLGDHPSKENAEEAWEAALQASPNGDNGG